MKILFICGSLEQGKDGIGDYTRKLAKECSTGGVTTLLVAVNDSYVNTVQYDTIDGIIQYRLPKSTTRKQKSEELVKIINSNSPVDWISLQFVSYAYNNKGVIGSKERKFFKSFTGIKLHVMMHEIWVGDENEASLKMKMLKWVQRYSIVSFIKSLKPVIIDTSVPLYKKILNETGLKVGVLPLFSNIGKYTFKPAHLPDGVLEDRKNAIIGCVFGSIYHDSWDLTSLFEILLQEKKRSNKEIIIVSLGKISYGEEFWNSLPAKYSSIKFLTLGMHDENYISYFLDNYVDFGIVTTPSIIAGKSGSCMAFLEHGIPVFCKKNTLTFSFPLSNDLIDERIIEIDHNSKFTLPEKLASFSQVKNSALIFIKNLKNAQ